MKNAGSRSYLLSSVLVILGFGLWALLVVDPVTITVEEKWKGVCWVGSRSPLLGPELEALKSTGADALSQTPFGWQSEKNSPEIRWDTHNENKWWGESSQGIKATFDSSARHGIMNMLKPHLWVRGSWPGEIEMKNEEDWKLWFENYQGFILDYAMMAEEHQIPMLCVGTELEMTSEREEDWRNVIAEIRKVYSGKLIYAANFTEFEHVKFWDALDYIGIQAYFPLSAKANPDLSDLKSGWKKNISRIEKVVRNYQKPVMFTEIGYCNTVDAAKEPWVWPNERKETELSEEMQALCYESFFETAWKESWMAGVFFWKWYPDGRHRNPDFTPQGKLAEEMMKKYFLAN
ncbi:hypothetical protein PBT90_04750 [Algoriphagus halophytocola]|uniref:Glycoside hydrolase n=1 Tax=Algoriphagus halophytocola TaxID=2991499 RepID=A0ABY6MGG3_9BACT|nr:MULTISPECIES: hypothetical protein [unclassified Algoriphagus]UZD22728.1 hypothetical protein OM944_19010 [Algoriphagus sp. TR-M5]WBL43993.1 hypothetical protein PBT90_04750 [Algoriphagus sp. TR-M9]